MQNVNQFLTQAVGGVKEAIRTGTPKGNLFLITGNESGGTFSLWGELITQVVADIFGFRFGFHRECFVFCIP
jgi:hypothetical protein